MYWSKFVQICILTYNLEYAQHNFSQSAWWYSNTLTENKFATQKTCFGQKRVSVNTSLSETWILPKKWKRPGKTNLNYLLTLKEIFFDHQSSGQKNISEYKNGLNDSNAFITLLRIDGGRYKSEATINLELTTWHS